MGFNNKIVNITVVSVLAIIFIFYVVSNALPSWIKVSSSSSEITTGLWALCLSSGGSQACSNYDCSGTAGVPSCSKVLAGRAFMTLACITSAISVICFIISMIMTDGIQPRILIIGKALVCACFVMGIIGVTIGIVAIRDINGGKLENGITLGAGSIIGIVALIINVFGVGISMIAK